MGTTSLVLAVIEAAQKGAGLPTAWRTLALADPVGDTQRVSRDLTLTRPLTLANGSQATAWQIQRTYLEGVREALGTSLEPGGEQADVLATWERILDLLINDRQAAAREVEWLAKWQVLQGLRDRHRLGWDHAKVKAADVQWSDLRPERGLYARLRAAGAVATMVSEQEVARAVTHPPRHTRAWFRGEAVRRYPDAVVAAGWNDIVFDVPAQPTLVRVPMPDPHRGTAALMADLLDAHPDPAGLVHALAGPGEVGEDA